MFCLQTCYVYHLCAIIRVDMKRLEEASDSLKLELQKVVTHHVGAGNPAQVL